MKIPAAERATVDPEKVRDYLLSRTHPVGKFKAAFFAGLGYQQEDWERLLNDLKRLAANDTAVPGQPSRFGNKYEVSATITGPSGRSAVVVTVWITRTGEEAPRLVTAYPGESR